MRREDKATMPESTSAGDPFGTSEIRRRVLAAWADAPARFREDANAEEDFALSGYRDRVVVELAQNAADAARRGNKPGRLRLSLQGRRFTAANTGAPLTPEGVESLSTLRASPKRDAGASTGRFGVGFSAVAAVSDDIVVSSSGSAVRFSQEDARQAVITMIESRSATETLTGLANEVHSRGGHVPALRLPFPCEPREHTGYDTEVAMLLRSEGERERVRGLLQQTGETLLVALTGLTEVVIEIDGQQRLLTRSEDADGADFATTVDGTVTLWRAVRRSGVLADALLADRPREERRHTAWTLTWATPVNEAGSVAPMPPDVEPVVYAPTPSDTALDLPAVLIGTFPLGADRRKIQPGPATDFLIAQAADAYCELLTRFEGQSVLDLVPSASLSSGSFEAALRQQLSPAIIETSCLVTHDGRRVAPSDAAILDLGTGEGAAPLADMLAPIVSGLLPGSWTPRFPALRTLGVRRLGLADVADILSGRQNSPVWWRQLYAAIRASTGHGSDLGELGALPVPLADGRLVQGARTALLPPPEWDGTKQHGHLNPDALAPLGLRVIHPDAADPLLERLGAAPVTAASALTDPRTEAAVRGSLESDDPQAISDAVLMLVEASGITTADVSWLSELVLRDDEDDFSAAAELVIPGAPIQGLLYDDAPLGTVHESVVERYGTEPLRAVGALWAFTVVRAENVEIGHDLDATFDGLIDGLDAWGKEVLHRLGDPAVPPMIAELVCVADLDLVADDRWPDALAMLEDSAVRAAVTAPCRVLTATGETIDVPSYSAWWLRMNARVSGELMSSFRTADADPALHSLYEEIPSSVDPALARAIGVRRNLQQILAEPGGPEDVLGRLGDPEKPVERDALRTVWRELARLDADLVTPPDQARAVRGDQIVVAQASDILILDQPELLPLVAGEPLIIVPASLAADLADVLDVALASEEVERRVTSTGSLREVPPWVREFLVSAASAYWHHSPLTVNDVEAEWSTAGGDLHASTDDGLARALCWTAGQWERRHLVAAALREPAKAAQLLAESEMD
ncbi:sacsin N-terminal ATP-binding-like domain-containing protein [Hoyosella subflava]|uniref:ATP-binding region ATPase domain protein n=1 Tax=Hoyosella subflava (strain DSM 45089 / JCM 17490 / NBRC 109087 / DQS3-9A1) TaxID=443218 RepID=F6EPV1_HOYSD|nr:ATPase domain-containing protein [Hoyosella subflava]AEF40580.1 ATP-binding region ATPase domain protein [Hoyosella subflava DQS3-9A1]